MSNIAYYFSFDFVKYAFAAAVLISVCASLLGVSLVLKRFSMIGDGLSHVAFGSIAIATVLGFAPVYFTIPVTALVAVILLKSGGKSKISGDQGIALMSVFALAFGYLILNLFSKGSNLSGDVCNTLFGSTSILTLSKSDVITCLVLAVLVILVYIIFYNRIFSVTFDEDFAKATGINTSLYNLALGIMTASVIVIALNLVGSLLVSALIVFPALTSMRLFKSYKGVTICSAAVAVICALIGVFLSIIFDTPVGATIVIAHAAALLLSFIISVVKGKLT